MTNNHEVFYSHQVATIDGETISLERFKNKTLLIVNVASRCGFTPQYAGLEKLYQTYQDKNFVVLGFPCNQFGKQEPGDHQEIKNFCETQYQITFPLFAKINVNGSDAHPLFVYLKKREKGILGSSAIKWNFTKFLVDKHGNVVKRFAPAETPESLAVEIERVL